MFWIIIFFFYLLAVLAAPFLLYFAPSVGVHEIGNFLLSLIGLAPLYGLAFQRRLLKRKAWVAYFAINATATAYMVFTVWWPLLNADALAFLNPGNLVAIAFLGSVLYGQYRYAFDSERLWA